MRRGLSPISDVRWEFKQSAQLAAPEPLILTSCMLAAEDLTPQAIQLRFSTTCCAVGDGLLFLGSDEGDVRVLDVGEFLGRLSTFRSLSAGNWMKLGDGSPLFL